MTTPYRLPTVIIIFLFLSCKGRDAVTTTRDTTKAKKDDAAGDDDAGSTKYVEHCRLELPDNTITLTTRYGVVNGRVDLESQYGAATSYFVDIDRKSGKADTIAANIDSPDGCIIRNMSDSFHIKTFVVQIVTQGLDIYYNNSFIGIDGGTFKELFSIMDTEEDGIKLHRRGSKLIGHMAGRDEIVESLEYDYPVIIDLQTFQQLDTIPDRQYIGFETRALQSFRAHRVNGRQTDSSMVDVKASTELTVDTLYRSLKKVRLQIGDSLRVEIKMETAKKKLQHLAAG